MHPSANLRIHVRRLVLGRLDTEETKMIKLTVLVWYLYLTPIQHMLFSIRFLSRDRPGLAHYRSTWSGLPRD